MRVQPGKSSGTTPLTPAAATTLTQHRLFRSVRHCSRSPGSLIGVGSLSWAQKQVPWVVDQEGQAFCNRVRVPRVSDQDGYAPQDQTSLESVS